MQIYNGEIAILTDETMILADSKMKTFFLGVFTQGVHILPVFAFCVLCLCLVFCVSNLCF